jgi:hypothetical protein
MKKIFYLYRMWWRISLVLMMTMRAYLLWGVSIAPDTLRKMSRFQITRYLIQAKQTGDQELISQLEERLLHIPPDPPQAPLDAGPGQWHWLSPTEGQTGEWLWKDASGKTYVMSPAVATTVGMLSQPMLKMPDMPPQDSQGPGQWLWRPEKNGTEGQWVWIYDDPAKGAIAGPRTPLAQGMTGIPQGVDAIVQEKTGEVPEPPANGSPSPDSSVTPGTILVKKPEAPRELTNKERILAVNPLLNEDALRALSPSEQQESDKIFLAVLKKIAHEVYVNTEKNQKTTVDINQKKKSFDTAFQAYAAFIAESFTQGAGMKQGFKKIAELLQLIGADDSVRGNNLFAYIQKYLVKENTESMELYLKRVKKNIDQYNNEVISILSPAFFASKNDIAAQIKTDVETIVINVAVSQRFLVPKKAVTIRGDIHYMDNPTPLQDTLNAMRVEDLLVKFIDVLQLAAQNWQEKTPLVGSDGRLILVLFRERLNRLRLDPEFYRFGLLIGSSLREQVAGKEGIEAIKNTPLIDVLDLYEEKYISFFAQPFNILLAVKQQLFFDFNSGESIVDRFINKNAPSLMDNLEESKKQGWTEEEIQKLMYITEIYKQAVTDYYVEIKNIIAERKKSIDVYAVINQPLTDIKMYEEIESTLVFLKKVGGTPERNKRIDSIIKELKEPQERFKPNADVIMNALKELVGRNTVDFEKNIRARIKAFIDKNKNAAQVVSVLEEAIKTNQKPFVKWVFDKLKENKIPITRYEKNFIGITRTAKDVYGALSSLAGRTVIAKIIREKDFYRLVEPYGILMLLFQQWPEDQKEKSAADRMKMLFKSLNVLDSKMDKVPRGAEAQYVATMMGTYAELLNDTHPYAGKLDNLIKSLKEFNFDKVTDEIKSIISQAGTGTENAPELSEITGTFYRTLARAYIENIVNLLEALNRGQAEEEIGALPLRENVYVYGEMAGAFSDLLNILSNINGQIADMDIDEIKKSIDVTIKTIMERVAKRGIDKNKLIAIEKNLTAFFDEIVKNFTTLQATTPAEQAVVSLSTEPIIPGGTTPPPPPAGGPPPPGGTLQGPPPPPSNGHQ